MAYKRVNWENLPSTKTPVNADNLNKMDKGIDAKQDKLTAGTGIEITGKNIINNIQGNYSTEEQVIGEWIDGKPLYRKVIVLTNVNIGYSEHLHNINNFSELIDIRGTYIDETKNFQKIPVIDLENLKLFSISFANVNNNSFAILIGTQRKNTNTIKVVLEYTKTTD